MQVDRFLPCHLADMVSAYANMVHHPGPLLDQMTQRILPKLDTMDAGIPQQTLQERRQCDCNVSKTKAYSDLCVHSSAACLALCHCLAFTLCLGGVRWSWEEL